MAAFFRCIICCTWCILMTVDCSKKDLYWPITKSEYLPQYSTSLMAHSLLMTIVTFIAFPLLCLYTMRLRKEYTATYKLIHSVVIMAVLASGVYMYVCGPLNEYKHLEHSTLGQTLMLIFVMQLIFPFIESDTIRKGHLFIMRYVLVLVLVPMQWFFGLNGLFLEPQFPYLPRTFYGHFWVGGSIAYFSVVMVWNSSTKQGLERIMNAESLIPVAALIEFVVEVWDRLYEKHWLRDKWHHVTIAIMWFITGLLCLLYRYLNRKSRAMWHHVTISFTAFVVGVAFLNHKIKGANDIMDEATYLHQVTGALFVVAACFKVFQRNTICGTLGICAGVSLVFSNNVICQLWHFGLKYSASTYAMFVVIFATFVTAINFVVFSQSRETDRDVAVFKDAQEEQEPFIINTKQEGEMTPRLP
eukprot:43803_1